jgi:hypothetical protein
MRYLFSLLAAAALFLMTAAAANYWVDPAQLFHQGYEAQLAKMLGAGKNVAVRPNYDERLLQKLLVEGARNVPDIVTLGSSRSMQVTQSNFAQLELANHSVSGATLEDHLAIYQLYRNKPLLPKIVLLNVDPWMFNKNYKSASWQSLGAEYRKITFDLGQHSTQPTMDGRLKQLISLSYLKTSLEAARSGAYSKIAPKPISTVETDVPVRRADGSLIWPAAIRNQTPEQIRTKARTYLTPPVYGLETFREIDPTAWHTFEALINLQKKEGIRTILLLVPYQPETYALLTAKPEYRIILDIETSLRRLAQRQGVPIIGSYNPALSHCDEQEFSDGMHPSTSCINKILAAQFPY